MRSLFSTGALAALLVSSAASAHAGLPETSNLTAREGDPRSLFVGATFGAVLSTDGGGSWNWVCPEAMGYGAWRPDAFLWKRNGTIFAATGNGLIRSSDGACTWSSHPAFAERWATAVSSHPNEPALLYVSTGRLAGGAGAGVYRSDDAGASFHPVLVREELAFKSVFVSPANPLRVYATGHTLPTPRAPVLFASADGGASWSEVSHSFGDARGPALVLLAGSPVDPDVLFARLYSGGMSYLQRSDDGGATFEEVLAVSDYVHGMEVSPDGRTVWAGAWVHLYRSTDAGRTFEPLADPYGNACARWVDGALYGCGSPWARPEIPSTLWSVAKSADLGVTWTPLFRFEDLRPPLQCPKGTPARDLCEPVYPRVAASLGIEPQLPPVDETPQPSAPEAPQGCGCSSAEGGVWWVLAWLPMWVRSRRRS